MSDTSINPGDQSIVDQTAALLKEQSAFQLALKKVEVKYQDRQDAARAKNQ